MNDTCEKNSNFPFPMLGFQPAKKTAIPVIFAGGAKVPAKHEKNKLFSRVIYLRKKQYININISFFAGTCSVRGWNPARGLKN